MRAVFFLIGILALALGAVGVILPLLPTVPLMILAAYCFARSSPALERRIVEHPAMKPHFTAWRERRAISRRGKMAALFAFAVSGAIGLIFLTPPIAFLPSIVGMVGGWWIFTRPTA